jgi:transcriptional regulator with XRE-family HTH domain
MVTLPRLRQLRIERALSQRDLCERSGVTQTTIVNAEKGKETRVSTLRKLADALGVDPRELIGTTDPHA